MYHPDITYTQMKEKTYEELTHCSPGATRFFHTLSNIRPLVWVAVYLGIIPIFALIYWGLPDIQFRIPDGSGTDFGSWIYYSIVTITTLGFGDYTPSHGWAQSFTAIEVALGLVVMGLFLNSVGSMKSAIDVEGEVEKQRRAHFALEKEKLVKLLPVVLHNIKKFLDNCYAVTTPVSERKSDGSYNPDFTFQDMASLYAPVGGGGTSSSLPAVTRLLQSAAKTSLSLDSLQGRVDLSLWPKVLDDCFSFVAGYQMLSSADNLGAHPETLFGSGGILNRPEAVRKVSEAIVSYRGEVTSDMEEPLRTVAELYFFIKDAADASLRLEKSLLEVSESHLDSEV